MPGIIRALADNMLTMDEPDHTRLRSIVDEAFRRRAILDMEPRILAIADELAGALFAESSPADLVKRFARRLPLSVICELLGLPQADRPKFMAWTNSFTRLTGAFGFLGLIPALLAMKRYLEGQLDRARKEGGEGLIAELVRVEKEGGRIGAREMVAMVFLPPQFGPLVPGNVHIAQPAQNFPHTNIGGGLPNIDCAEDLERWILHEGPSSVAAFIAEPISAGAGIHVPDDGYWPKIRETCTKYGVVMIGDEVITGFCRSGRMFAFDHWGVTPDIRTVAKGLTSGYMPIGAAIVSGKIADAFIGSADKTFAHLITFGGNPVSCAAALANLEIMENEKFADRAAEMGDYLYEQLQSLRKYPIVGDVRGGKGLLCAIEIVKDQKTREPFPKSANLNQVAVQAMRTHRMLGRAGQVIPIAPPLCITREQIDEAVHRLGKVLTTIGTRLGVA